MRTIGSTVLPGLGMLGTRMHRLGVLLLSLILVAAVVLGIIVLRNPLITAGNALQSGWMRTIAISLIVVLAVWVSVIIGTYLISRPRKLTSRQRTIGGVVVGVLTFIVSAPLSVASSYSFETARLSGDIFGSQNDSKSQTRPTLDNKKDPWADKERVNILLLGGDSGAGREEELGVRTDTMMMASIDTKTGATLIIQLPRNLQHPIFAADSPLAQAYPYGFDDGAEGYLSSVWQDAPAMFPEYFENTDYPGADALKWAFEGATDQKVDYFVLVNIDGLVNLIDAMGGVTVNVNFPIAKGGSSDYNCGEFGYIPEGPDQLLGGDDAMWYARSRCNSPGGDFGRMQRQSCLVNAVIDQADPATMLTRYEDIAQAAGDMVSTDIPQEHLSAIVDLAGRVQRGGIVNRISFVDDATSSFSSAYPDFDMMHEEIATAIKSTQDQAEGKDSPQTEEPAPESTDNAAPPADAGQPEEPASGEAENVSDACAYRHEEPEGPWIIPDSVPRYTPPASEPAQTPR